MAEPMDISADPYVLSATLAGHEQDVRSVGSLPDGRVVTGSRDSSVRVWKRGDAGFDCAGTLLGHTHYVGAVCSTPDGTAASGSNDKHVIEWNLETGVPARILAGHEQPVSCVIGSPLTGLLYSASWDKTAKVWQDGTCVRTLKGHEAALWSVLPVDELDGHVLTASADRTIKLWDGEACVRTFSGHTDVVRALAAVAGIGFLSASNDGTVRLWELGGSCLSVLHASDSFVYSVSVLPSGEWLTCSEDRTVKVWSSEKSECTQVLTHPSTIWASSGLVNGDIVAGCADGNAYVWTRSAERAAELAQQAAFKESVAAVGINAQQVQEGMLGDLDVTKLASEEALLEAGTKEGQHKIVKDGTSGVPTLYQWSVASASWEKVGEVVGGKETDGASATLGKRAYQGAEYDYLFDIDINGSMLKLPFNRGDDPWMVAQKWVWDNDLDQAHLDAIANHIVTNTPGNVAQQPAGNADPFTSGGGYRPGAAPGAGAGGGGNVDPFTSGGAYVPGAGAPAAPAARAPAAEDPTSAKRYRPGDAAAAAATASTTATFLYFDACKHEQVLAKLIQFNEQLVADEALAAGAAPLDAAGKAALTALVDVLKNRGMFHATKVSAADLSLFLGGSVVHGAVICAKPYGGLLAWPTALLFPALDLLRLLALHPAVAPHIVAAKPPLVPRLLALLIDAKDKAPADKFAANAYLMLIRTLSNMASKRELVGVVKPTASDILDVLSHPIEAGPAGARLAAITCVYNLTSMAADGGLTNEAALRDESLRLQALSLVAHALAAAPSLAAPAEEEALLRLLAALGALLSHAGAAEVARDLEIPGALGALALAPTAGAAALALKAKLLADLAK